MSPTSVWLKGKKEEKKKQMSRNNNVLDLARHCSDFHNTIHCFLYYFSATGCFRSQWTVFLSLVCHLRSMLLTSGCLLKCQVSPLFLIKIKHSSLYQTSSCLCGLHSVSMFFALSNMKPWSAPKQSLSFCFHSALCYFLLELAAPKAT